MHWRPDDAGRVRIPLRTTSLRNFGNSVYPALPVFFGGDTKSRRSLLSGDYARGSKRSHQSALECLTVVDSTTRSKKNSPPPECDYAAENAALHFYRKKKKKKKKKLQKFDVAADRHCRSARSANEAVLVIS